MPFLPQEQSHVNGLASGRLAPQLEQKLPVFPFCPQAQSQVSVPTGAGFLAPQLEQKFPVMPFWPQVQSHAPAETGDVC